MSENPWVISQLIGTSGRSHYWAGGDDWGSVAEAVRFPSKTAAKQAWREKTGTTFGRHLSTHQLTDKEMRRKLKPEPPIEVVEAEFVDEPAGTALEVSTTPFAEGEAVDMGMPHPNMSDAELGLDDKTVEELAAIANREHMAYEKTASRALEHAWYAGKALLAAKAQLAHGEWLPWLATNFAPSQQTASLYMQVAANYARVSNFPDLSLRAAIRSIKASKKDEREADPNYVPPPPRQKPVTTGNSVPVDWTIAHMDEGAWEFTVNSTGHRYIRIRDGILRMQGGQFVDFAGGAATLTEQMATEIAEACNDILDALSD